VLHANLLTCAACVANSVPPVTTMPERRPRLAPSALAHLRLVTGLYMVTVDGPSSFRPNILPVCAIVVVDW